MAARRNRHQDAPCIRRSRSSAYSWNAGATELFWHANMSDISVGQVSTIRTRFTALNGLPIHGQIDDRRQVKTPSGLPRSSVRVRKTANSHNSAGVSQWTAMGHERPGREILHALIETEVCRVALR